MQKPLQNYIPALTGVRAFAAYLVFISHYAYAFDEIFPRAVQRFLSEFHIGVTIFFVLSGFLIAFRYFDSFKLTGDWFRQYLKNRVARIYPMYFLLTLGAFVSYYFTHDQKITNGFASPIGLFFMHITFVRGFFDQLKFTGIAQGWSLTVEECFYFSAPFIFYFAQKYRRFYIQPVVITLAGATLVLIFSHVDWYGFFGNFTFMMLYTFLGRCFEFFAGIQLALIVRKKNLDGQSKSNYTYLGFLLIFVCVGIMSVLPIPKGEVAGLHHPFGIITNNYLLASSIALFFYGLLTETTVLKKILSNPFIELLGKSSYIFYLIHLGYMYDFMHNYFNKWNDDIFELYDKWGKDWISPFQYDALNVLYAFILLNAISILLFKTIEEPLNHYIRRSNFLIKNKPRNPENNSEAIKA
ncbi:MULTISPECIES: acyltransferase [unclassified Mucilaginibacter]|uniref:acyltransferase family protein n=1 Tax=unclassified Mucilaginibacter TaxID=2617802 RepID=UPI002AC8F39A|nr:MULTISPECIES: acyltransferase [unclassified Mucilaginibacter]MEB0263387.1 acyltransferase [Mucilaginibacter sp. 10I4]MEB0278584.1 acyltransferase [Mucilaginibacter sp. 10B2]MEB0299294.1 acyltransferase [Mucilaginibacter sp. 5C4]WPX23461.1 acyltransferase [Mucilaginibacter sp. 5C4]